MQFIRSHYACDLCDGEVEALAILQCFRRAAIRFNNETEAARKFEGEIYTVWATDEGD